MCLPNIISSFSSNMFLMFLKEKFRNSLLTNKETGSLISKDEMLTLWIINDPKTVNRRKFLNEQ